MEKGWRALGKLGPWKVGRRETPDLPSPNIDRKKRKKKI